MKIILINKWSLLIAALLALAPPVRAALDFTGTLWWNPSGSGDSMAGGSGNWSDANAWRNTTGPLTWQPGTGGAAKDYGCLIFGGIGQTGTYTLALDLDSIEKTLAAGAGSSNLTVFGLRFSGDYKMISTASNGTTLAGLGNYSSVYILVDSGRNLLIDGSDKPITIVGNANVSGDTADAGAYPTVLFAGGGNITLGESVNVRQTASLNSRIAVGAVGDASMTTLDLNGEDILFQGSRLWLDNAIVNVNGAYINLSGHATSQTRRSVLHIGSMIAGASTAPSVLNINSGTVSALGNPSASALASGVWYLEAGAAGSGGTINLNGGELITTNIRVNTAATADQTAEFIFNGGTLTVAAIATNNHLTTFIDGFKNSETNHVVIAEGGAYINTGEITGNTAYIKSVISGSGSLTKLGANTLSLDAINTYTGATQVTAGELRITSADGIATSSAVSVATGATLHLNNQSSLLRNLTGAGTVVIGAGDLTVFADGTGVSLFSGAITGAGSLVKSGSGTLLLTAPKSYTGGITVSEGRLQGNTSSLTGNISNNGVLSFAQENDGAYAGIVSGAGSLEKTGAGRLTLTQAQSYSGGLSILAGTLQGDASSLLGDIANNGTVVFAQQTDGLYAGALSGTGVLEKTGDGTLTIAQAGAHTGYTNITQGELKAGAANIVGASSEARVAAGARFDFNNYDQTLRGLAGGGYVAMGNNTLTIFTDNGAQAVFSGTLSGAGGFIKNGAGTQILSGINSYTGATFVNAGALLVTSAATLLGSDITVANGATFGGQGTVGASGKTASMSASAILQIGLNPLDGPATLTINSALSLDSVRLAFDLYAGGTSDRLLIGNDGSLAAIGINRIDIGLFTVGTFNLGNITGLVSADISVGGRLVSDPSSRQSASLNVQGTDLILTTGAGPSRILTWTGATSAAWDENWKADGTPNIIFATGDSVRLDSASDAGNETNRNINIGAATAVVSDIFVSGNGNYTITGGALVADRTSIVDGSTEITAATATGKLAKQGGGRLTLANSGVNDFRGGVDLGGGTLVLASAGALGASNLNVTGPAASVEIGVGGIDMTGAVNVGTFGLTLDTLENNTIISGVISGAGGVTKKGAGTLTLGGANTFAGTLAVDAGVVSAGSLANLGAAASSVSIANGATLSLVSTAPGNLAFNRALAGQGLFIINLANAADNFAFTAGAGNAFAGTLQLDKGVIALDSAAAATLANATLKLGANAIAQKAGGDISISSLAFNGGMLEIPTTPGLGVDGLLSVNTLDTGAAVNRIALDTSLFTTPQVNPANPGVFDQSIITEVRLVAANEVLGTGAFVVASKADGSALPNPTQIALMQNGQAIASASYGNTVVAQTEGGNKGLYLGHGITAIDVFAGKTLLLDNTDASQSRLLAEIAGEGSIDVRASGAAITLGAENTFTGATFVSKGTLRAGTINILRNSAALHIAPDTTFDLASLAQTVNNLEGAGAILLGSAALTVNNTEDTEFSGNISGSGRLIKTGADTTLTLSGNNQHSGGTAVSAGRLRVTAPWALGSGAISVESAATLEFDGVGETYIGAAVTGGGKIDIIDSNVVFSATNNAFSALNLTGRSQVTAFGAGNSIGGTSAAINVGAGSVLAIAAKNATVRAGSLTLDGGRLLFHPGSALAVQNAITTTSGGAITFGGSGVSQLSYGSLGGGLVYDVPAGMTLDIADSGGNALTYTVVNQSASPLKDIAMTFASFAATQDAVTGHMSDDFLLPVGEPSHRQRKSKWDHFAWAKTLYSKANYENTERQAGRTDRTNGYIAGIDALRSERFLAGVYVGTATNKLNTENHTRVEANQQFAGMYFAVRDGSLYFSGGLSGARFVSDSYRNEIAGQTTASYDIANYGINLEMGCLIGQDTETAFKPFAGIRYMKTSMKNYRERGTSAMNITDFTDRIVQSNVGLQASRAFKMPWDSPAMIDFSAGWRHMLCSPRDQVDAAFALNPEQNIILLGENGSKGSVFAKIALRTAIGRKAILSMGYENESSSDRMRHVFHASLGFWW